MVVIFLPAALPSGRLAGARGLAVNVHRAGAAGPDAAPVFRAGELQMLADDPEERHLRAHFDLVVLPVDIQ